MKKTFIITVLLFFNYTVSISQILPPNEILPATLDVRGMPSFIQNINDVVTEAGLDDSTVGFESNFDETLIDFVLDPVLLVPSITVCEGNVYLYKVYINTVNAPDNVIIEAKTTTNSGQRVPASSVYDILNIPFGPRGLTPENGGTYITVPNNPNQAIKIFEFVGCRTDIPIQYRIKPSVLAPAQVYDFDINFTITATLPLP